MLWRKLFRDLWRQRWQSIPLLLVLGLGTAVFVACFVGYDSLRASYEETQERTRLADVSVETTGVTGEEARQIRTLPGVAEVDLQTVLSVPVQIGTGKRAEARLVSIPVSGQQVLNQVVVESGRYPAESGEVLVEHHFAAYHKLRVGDTLQMGSAEGVRPVKVAGVAVAAEYLWVARNEFDIMPSPAEFGVLFVPRPLLAEMGLADRTDGGNRLLYNLAPGADADRVLESVKAALGSDRVLADTARADLVGIQVLHDDIDSFAEVAGVLPAFFLAVVALILATIMSRQVDRERPIVGTMLALGMSRHTIMEHYLGYGLVTGVLATGLGSLAGVAMGNRFAGLYARELLIPFVTLRVNAWVVVTGIALGLAVAVLACFLPARRAAGLHPAEAMRPGASLRAPEAPWAGRPGGVTPSRTPIWWRLALRNVRRQPVRTLGSIFGVTSALVLLIGTAGMVDSATRWFELALWEGPRYDLRVDLAAPVPSAELEGAVKRIDGVQSVQSSLALPVQLRHGGRSEQAAAQVLPRTSHLVRVLTTDGRDLTADDGQVLVSEAVAKKLGLAVGDVVDLTYADRTIRRTVGGLSGNMMMEPVALHGPEPAEALGLRDRATTALVTVTPGRSADVKEALQKLPAAVRVSDQGLMHAQVTEMMGLAYLVIAVMFGCGAVLAGCILLNTVMLNVVERQRELATMRADGQPLGSLAWLITAETLLTSAIGAAIGLPLGVLGLRFELALYDSTLFSMPLVVKPATLGLALVSVLVVMLLAEVPALRHVARLNLAEATRTRE